MEDPRGKNPAKLRGSTVGLGRVTGGWLPLLALCLLGSGCRTMWLSDRDTAVRAQVGTDFPIEIRISGSELSEGGLILEDVIETCRIIENKVDLIHVSAGTFSAIDTITTMHPSMFLPHGCNVYLAEAVKKAVNIPVVTVGGLSDPRQMEGIVRSGKADIVALARGLLADPDLPRKARYGKDKEIVHCLRCFDCLHGFRREMEIFFVHPVVFHLFRMNRLKRTPSYMKSDKGCPDAFCIQIAEQLFCEMKAGCRRSHCPLLVCIDGLITIPVQFPEGFPIPPMMNIGRHRRSPVFLQ